MSLVDGVWTAWGSWGQCTVTCGGGKSTKTRTCTNPRPQHGGAPCAGADNSKKDCNTQVCISTYNDDKFTFLKKSPVFQA